MDFYSHCNLLAHCFLRSQRSKNKQIRGSLTEPNREIFQGLPASPHQGSALDPLGDLSLRPPAVLSTPLACFKDLRPLL